MGAHAMATTQQEIPCPYRYVGIIYDALLEFS